MLMLQSTYGTFIKSAYSIRGLLYQAYNETKEGAYN